MADHVAAFNFSKVWTSPADFPTYEGSEEQVRADMQLQPDELKAYVNVLRGKVNDLLDAIETIVAGSVPDDSITAAKLTSNSVITVKIQDLAVTTAKIALLAVTEALLAPDSVTRDKIKNGEVIRSKLADKAVSATQIDDKTITAAQIADGTVNSALLGSDILPAKVGIKMGKATPTTATLAEGQLYFKYS